MSHLGIANTYSVDISQSVFAIVTQKAGIAKAVAHDHLIAAQNAKVALSIPDEDILKGSFSFNTEVKSLLVDDPKAQKKWTQAIAQAGIVAEFSELDDGDRATIAESMLDEGQLNAERYPSIEAKVISLKPSNGTMGKINTNYLAELELKIHGKVVKTQIPCEIKKSDKAIEVTAVGKFKFTQFGIEPYSALFGAIGNQGDFG